MYFETQNSAESVAARERRWLFTAGGRHEKWAWRWQDKLSLSLAMEQSEAEND